MYLLLFIFTLSLDALISQVKKIVQGQYDLFQTMYRPYLEEYATKDLLTISTSQNNQVNITQVFLRVFTSHFIGTDK